MTIRKIPQISLSFHKRAEKTNKQKNLFHHNHEQKKISAQLRFQPIENRMNLGWLLFFIVKSENKSEQRQSLIPLNKKCCGKNLKKKNASMSNVFSR